MLVEFTRNVFGTNKLLESLWKVRPAAALFLDWKHVKCVPPLPHTAFNALGAVESPAAQEGTLTPPLGFPSSTVTEQEKKLLLQPLGKHCADKGIEVLPKTK